MCETPILLLEKKVPTTHITATSGAGLSSDLTQCANRTLDFLNILEKTLKSFTREVDLIRAIRAGVDRQIALILKAPASVEIDAAGRAIDLLTKAAAAAERSYAETLGSRSSAMADADLFEDDGVVECFTDLAEAFANLHSSIELLRHAVENHDANLSPVIGTFENVDDMLAALKS